jgi:kynurenine formamidase
MKTAGRLALAAFVWLLPFAALAAQKSPKPSKPPKEKSEKGEKAERERGEKPAPGLDLARARIVDLTHPFAADTLYWPTSTSGFEHKELHRGPTPAGFFYSAYSFCAPEHGGTHVDAPSHFAESGRGAGDIALDRLVAPAAVIDVARKALADPDYRLTAADVREWEKANGELTRGTIVLLRTGWSTRWPDAKLYLGDDTKGDASKLHFPALGKEAAELLVARKVAAIGVDTASIDHGPSQDFVVHQVVAAANMPAFENLTGLERVPATRAWVIALPMKIAAGSGAPLRIVALVPR